MSTDLDLLEAFRRLDPARIDGLTVRERDAAFRVLHAGLRTIRGRDSSAGADEAIQQVLIRYLRRGPSEEALAKTETDAGVLANLRTAYHRAVIDQHRRRTRRAQPSGSETSAAERALRQVSRPEDTPERAHAIAVHRQVVEARFAAIERLLTALWSDWVPAAVAGRTDVQKESFRHAVEQKLFIALGESTQEAIAEATLIADGRAPTGVALETRKGTQQKAQNRAFKKLREVLEARIAAGDPNGPGEPTAADLSKLIDFVASSTSRRGHSGRGSNDAC